MARRLDDLLQQVAGPHVSQIVVKEVIPDHVHLLVRVTPTDAHKWNFVAGHADSLPKLTNTPRVTSSGLDWPITRKPREQKPGASSRQGSHQNRAPSAGVAPGSSPFR